jgi:hypothetical protein
MDWNVAVPPKMPVYATACTLPVHRRLLPAPTCQLKALPAIVRLQRQPARTHPHQREGGPVITRTTMFWKFLLLITATEFVGGAMEAAWWKYSKTGVQSGDNGISTWGEKQPG